MKRSIVILLSIQLILLFSPKLLSQTTTGIRDFGVSAGGLTNFPCNKDYLNKSKSMVYLAPYIRYDKHEFSAGIVYPFKTDWLHFSESKINPVIGVIAGYKFYVFNMYGAENLFIHYLFEYVRYKGTRDVLDQETNQTLQLTEKDMYINNVIGAGYNIFFGSRQQFGLFYTVDYVVSQTSYNLGLPGATNKDWTSRFEWNNLSTQIGLSFKLTSLKKEEKK